MKSDYDENLNYCLIKDAFQTCDKDNDGYITLKEMATVMRYLGLTINEQELSDIAKIYDKDDTGKIEFTEFFHVTQQKTKSFAREDDLIEGFKLYDLTNEGVVPADDISRGMINTNEKISKEEIDELLKNIPHREDDQVSYEEFIRMMLAK